MERTEMELVDDIWRRIIALLPSIQRANCIFVSKKWRALVLNPLVWQTVEVSFAKKTVTHDNDNNGGVNLKKNQPKSAQDAALDSASRSDNFIQFFQKICTAVVDLNLEVDLSSTNTGVSSILDSIFQLRTLERFRFALINNQKKVQLGTFVSAQISSKVNEYNTALVPACKDLKLLNFESAKGLFIYPKGYQTLFSGLPNLEEFYPIAGMPFDPKLFANTPKLKRLDLCPFAYSPDIRMIIDECPSLEYITMHDEEALAPDVLAPLQIVGLSAKLRKYKNTYIVFSTIFDTIGTLSKEHLNILKPLLTTYTKFGYPFLSHVVAQCNFSLRDTLNVLVNEMHFDINGRDTSGFHYRPSICRLSSSLLTVTYPIEVAARNADKLKILLEFNPQVEIPETSLLAECRTIKSALLLLQHGADPHRIVTLQQDDTLPVYVPLIFNLSLDTDDPYLVVHELGKRGCDFNKTRADRGESNRNVLGESEQISETTLLQELIRAKKFLAIDAMLDYGAKWEWSKTAIMFAQRRLEKFEQLLRKGKIDVKTMPIKLAVALCAYNMAPLLTDCFEVNKDLRDEKGLNLAHYIPLMSSSDSPLRPTPSVKWKSLTEFDRWIVEVPKKSLFTSGISSDANTLKSVYSVYSQLPIDSNPASSKGSGFDFSSGSKTSGSGFSFSSTAPSFSFNSTTPSTLLPSVPSVPSDFSFSNKTTPTSTTPITPPNPTTGFSFATNNPASNTTSSFWSTSSVTPINSTPLVPSGAVQTLDPTKSSDDKSSPLFSFTSSIPPPSSSYTSFSFTSSKSPNSSSAASVPQPSAPSFSFTSNIPSPNSNAAFSFNLSSPSTSAPNSSLFPSVPPSSAPAFSFTSSIAPPNPSTAFSFNAQLPSLSAFKFSDTDNNEIKTPVKVEPIKKYDWARDFKDIFVKQIGIDLNAKNDKGDTPLHTLMRANADPFMKLQRAMVMIESGADPLAKNNIGESVLSTACLHGVWEVVFVLLEKYNANLNEQDNNGLTPLMNAIYGYKHNDIDEQHEFDVNFARVLTKYPVDFSLQDEYGRSLPHLLASLGDKELLIPYLDKMDVNARDESGFTPLHYAIMFGNDQLIEPLIKCGADVNAQTTSLKLTPLMLLLHITYPSSPYYSYLYHYATMFFGSFTGKVHYYSQQPPPAFVNKSRAHPFTTKLRNVPETIELLRAKSDMSLTDRLGNSVQQLLASGPSPQHADDFHSPLIHFIKHLLVNTHKPVQVDWISALKSYLDHRDDAIIHARDSNGNTPLHIACQFFHMGVADSIFACLEDEHQSAPYCLVAFMLLEFGADPTLKNNKGETPLDYVPNLKELSSKKYEQVLKATKEVIRLNVSNQPARSAFKF